VTIADVMSEGDDARHGHAVRTWAQSVWTAYHSQQQLAREGLDQVRAGTRLSNTR
jgi:hypothetical protein